MRLIQRIFRRRPKPARPSLLVDYSAKRAEALKYLDAQALRHLGEEPDKQQQESNRG